jgi:intracellular sulfur oxidation DsrE/DsrF family protein
MKIILWLSLAIFISAGNLAAAEAPWGSASVTEIQYKPQKVVYDVAVNSVEKVTSVLDRASYLSKITGADPFDSSIVLVLHGGEIDYFAIKNYARHSELMQRAQSLVESEVLKIRMCRIAAQGHGYEPEDIHGFVEMVPMGDAEIIRLQNEENHAYMR